MDGLDLCKRCGGLREYDHLDSNGVCRDRERCDFRLKERELRERYPDEKRDDE